MSPECPRWASLNPAGGLRRVAGVVVLSGAREPPREGRRLLTEDLPVGQG